MGLGHTLNTQTLMKTDEQKKRFSVNLLFCAGPHVASGLRAGRPQSMFTCERIFFLSFFSRLNSIPLSVYATVSSPAYPLMDTDVAFLVFLL